MPDFPRLLTARNDVQPCPRRIRGFLAGIAVFDTVEASYVWEFAPYPQYYVPIADVRPGALVDTGERRQTPIGTARLYDVTTAAVTRSGAALGYDESTLPGLAGTVRVDWSALDAWYEEDERVYVHPRSPYTRVDVLRSSREVVVSAAGLEIARSTSPLLLFETGLPVRYYLDRTDVRLDLLRPSATETSCPYKGTTSGYWSLASEAEGYDDIAWSYEFPAREVLAIAGLIAFYDEKVDITVDGRRLERQGSGS